MSLLTFHGGSSSKIPRESSDCLGSTTPPRSAILVSSFSHIPSWLELQSAVKCMCYLV